MKRTQTIRDIRIHHLIERRALTKTTYILRLERNNLDFTPGQYISIGKAKTIDKRDYSIYSPDNEDYLEVLIKEVSDGMVSKELRKLEPGAEIEVEGPFGYFQINPQDKNKKFVFIASGTGISPFHSMIHSNPEIDYTLLHGIRRREEAYEQDEYQKGRYIACTSRDGSGDFYGRVTDYLNLNKANPEALYFLCGNSEMINDAFDILEEQGVPSDNIHAEVYF